MVIMSSAEEVFRLLEEDGLIYGKTSRLAKLFCDMRPHYSQEFLVIGLPHYDSIIFQINTLLAQGRFTYRIKKQIWDDIDLPQTKREYYVLVDLSLTINPEITTRMEVN